MVSGENMGSWSPLVEHGANFMGMIPLGEPPEKLAALEAQSGAMTSLTAAITRRLLGLGVHTHDHQAWKAEMWEIVAMPNEASSPDADWARLALAIERCVPHLQEELREMEELVSQNTGLKETSDSCNANA